MQGIYIYNSSNDAYTYVINVSQLTQGDRLKQYSVHRMQKY